MYPTMAKRSVGPRPNGQWCVDVPGRTASAESAYQAETVQKEYDRVAALTVMGVAIVLTSRGRL